MLIEVHRLSSLSISRPLGTIYHRKCHEASRQNWKKARWLASFTRRQTLHLVIYKSWQPVPASALSNAIRFVGEKDEGDSQEKGEKTRFARQEKPVELSVINTLNFFPGRAPDLTRSFVH